MKFGEIPSEKSLTKDRVIEEDLEEKNKEILDKFLKGKKEYFFNRYVMMPKEERESMKNFIQSCDSTKLTEEQKDGLLLNLEKKDEEAEKRHRRAKEFYQKVSPEERNKSLKEAQEEVQARKEADKRIKEREEKFKELSPEGKLEAQFREMDADEIEAWKNRFYQSKQGNTEIKEMEILEKVIEQRKIDARKVYNLPPEEKAREGGIRHYEIEYRRHKELGEQYREEDIDLAETEERELRAVLGEIEEGEEEKEK